MPHTLSACADQLNQSPDFQVLTRLAPCDVFTSPTPQAVHKICILDTETTGLDTSACEVIELGYQIIEFDSLGNMYRVLTEQNFLNEPTKEIPKEVTQVTGITIDDVKGHKIDWEVVAADMADVSLIVAHNAGFDRPVVERCHPIFAQKVWGCTVSQINWAEVTGVSSRTQDYLCWKLGHFFYDAHRALTDVQALSKLLATPVGKGDSADFKPALSYLLPTIRKSKAKVKASGAPFSMKDDLKSRSYRWDPDNKVWQKIIDEENLEAELDWLKVTGCAHPDVIKLKATDTFSVRAQA